MLSGRYFSGANLGYSCDNASMLISSKHSFSDEKSSSCSPLSQRQQQSVINLDPSWASYIPMATIFS